MRNIYGVFGTVALGAYIGFSLLKYGSIDILDSGFFIFGAIFSYIMYQWKKSVYRSIIFPILFGTFVAYLVEIL